MGQPIAVLIVVIGIWGSLAQIMPDVFQVNRKSRLMQYIWGANSKWIAFGSISLLMGFYVWNLENRLSSMAASSVSVNSPNPPDGSGLLFASWWPFPDGSGCGATIDASKLPQEMRDKFEIALICGFSDPSVDRFKDTRISVSALFTPVNTLTISIPFSKIMSESLANDQEMTVKKIQPPPRHGSPITLGNQIWIKAALLPKGTDTSNIHRLSDVPLLSGKIAGADAGVGITRRIIAK